MSERLKNPKDGVLLYPWHRPYWESLRACRRQDRMPHALLLAGPVGIGKRSFAAALVQAFACDRPREDGCGCDSCPGCRLQRAGSHPDHRILLPLEGKQTISVDRIRRMQAHLTLKARHSRLKTMTLFPADGMTLNAANSLLKVLEEPPGETLILLLTSAPEKLPITVRSRCQRLRLAPPNPQEAKTWLKARCGCADDRDLTVSLALAKGAPLRALAYIERDLIARRRAFIEALSFLPSGAAEPLGIAKNWLRDDRGEVLYWIATLVGDMIRLKSGVAVPYLINRDSIEVLQTMTRAMSFHRLFNLWWKVSDDWRLWEERGSINSQFLLEGLLIHWTVCFREAGYA